MKIDGEGLGMKRTTWLIVALAVLLQTGAVAADPVGPKLTARLKQLLTREMQQVAGATAKLALSIVMGDHDRAHELGVAVRDSFILKKSLTAQDKKDLKGAVPRGFLALDKRFHGLAGKLAQAAKKKDSEGQGFYFSEMMKTCVACHSLYATDRFPGLKPVHRGSH